MSSEISLLQGDPFRPSLLQGDPFRPSLLQGDSFRPSLLQGHPFRPSLLQGDPFRPSLLQGHPFRPSLLQGDPFRPKIFTNDCPVTRLNITVQKWRDIVSDQKQKCQTHVCECQSIDHRIFIKLPLSLSHLHIVDSITLDIVTWMKCWE